MESWWLRTGGSKVYLRTGLSYMWNIVGGEDIACGGVGELFIESVSERKLSGYRSYSKA